MKLIDTHAHLAYEELEGVDFDEVNEDVAESLVARAKEAGVYKIVNVATTLKDSRVACKTAARFDNVFGTIGVHPHETGNLASEEDRQNFADLREQFEPVAIGEIGLDYYQMRNSQEDQMNVFEFQLQLAKDSDLPVLIHSRDAFDDTLAKLKEFGVRGLIHSFTYNKDQARAFLDAGFLLAFNGILTFKNATDIQEAARFAPLDRIVLETDAPFLAPEPLRGKTNEPAYIVHTAEFLARLREEILDDVAEATTANAEALLNI